MTFFLIDFENVQCSGLRGLEDLNCDDCVIIFFTDHANMLNMNSVAGSQAVLKMIKSPMGSQMLDKVLLSFLGYMIGSESDSAIRYVIVSQDKGYREIALFWNDRCGDKDKVVCRNTIAPDIPLIQEDIVSDSTDSTAVSQYSYLLDLQILGRIQNIIRKYGSVSRGGYKMLFCELCTYLHQDKVFLRAQKASGLKLGSYIRNVYGHFLDIFEERVNVLWVRTGDLVVDIPTVSCDDTQAVEVLTGDSASCALPDMLGIDAEYEEECRDPEDTAQYSPDTDAAICTDFPNAPLESRLIYRLYHSGMKLKTATDVSKFVVSDLERSGNRRGGSFRFFLARFGQKDGMAYYRLIKDLLPVSSE